MIPLGKLPVDQVVQSGVRLCQKVMLEILRRGAVPDWHKLELVPNES